MKKTLFSVMALIVVIAFVFTLGCSKKSEEIGSAFEETVKPAAQPSAPAPAAAPSAPASVSGLININTASSAELQSLTGVGPSTANNIIESRTTDGPFSSVDDITRVKGIGPATLAKFRDQITVGDGATVSDEAPITETVTTAVSTAVSGAKININTASSAELQKLTGVGPSTAGKIIEYRTENGPFASIEDITKVKGIGPKTLDKFRDMITVD